MSHLTFDERVMICLLLTEGYRQNEIAARLNRSPSTISRELRRNRHPSGQYQACEAGRKAALRIPSVLMLNRVMARVVCSL